jgi:hypothetical protein
MLPAGIPVEALKPFAATLTLPETPDKADETRPETIPAVCVEADLKTVVDVATVEDWFAVLFVSQLV